MKTKWPKQIPELSEVQQKVRDEWMRYWHEELPSRYGIIEEFNHGFPLAFTKLRKLKMRGGGGRKPLKSAPDSESIFVMSVWRIKVTTL
jgi:hypothetical protein